MACLPIQTFALFYGADEKQFGLIYFQFKCQLFFFKLTTNQKFDIAIMIVILLNMMTMAMEHFDQSPLLTTVLYFINQVFVVIFSVECVMKILGLRWHYFKQPWNVFDFCVVVVSILGPSICLITFLQLELL